MGRREGVGERIRDNGGAFWGKQGLGQFATQGNTTQVYQQTPACCTVRHHFPDRRFHQSLLPSACQPWHEILDTSHFAPGPDLVQGGFNLGKGSKALASGMQEDQIVVSLEGKLLLCGNPIDTPPGSRQATCRLGFGLLAILSFLVLHPRFSDEQPPSGQGSHHIGQVIVGFTVEDIANGKWCLFGNGETVGRSELGGSVRTENIVCSCGRCCGVLDASRTS